MNDSKPPGRIVEFGVTMKPSGFLKVMPPADRADRAIDPLTPEELHRGTKGGLMIMKILGMSDEDKQAHVVTQVGDPLFMWWSFLTPEERRQFIKAAEANLRETLMG